MLTKIHKQYFKISLKVVAVLIMLVNTHHTSAETRPIDRNAHTIYYNNRPPNKNGNFHYEFQTSNGITTKSAGNEHGFSGVVQYVSPEGLPITLTYVADSDGYHPTGEHIPKIPEHIIRSLEYIRTHPVINEKESRKL